MKAESDPPERGGRLPARRLGLLRPVSQGTQLRDGLRQVNLAPLPELARRVAQRVIKQQH